MSRKIVFCGGGNMAEGIFKQVLAKGVTEPENITVAELREDRASYIRETYGIASSSACDEAYKGADVIVLAVLPQHFKSALSGIKPFIRDDAVVISIAAGVSIDSITSVIGCGKHVSRVLPNTMGESGHGYSVVCYNSACTDDDKIIVSSILDSIGQTMLLPERLFDAYSCFGTAGPLWMYKLVEAMTDAGVYVGFNREDARNIVIQNMIGAGMTLAATGEHPVARVDRMTSPCGVTIESLKVLQEEGFSSAIMSSISAGVNKAQSF